MSWFEIYALLWPLAVASLAVGFVKMLHWHEDREERRRQQQQSSH
jgi:hypothetical protein